MTSTKVKSLFKGLRSISQIFDEKEEEMQIGFPTDVKHVAHIGWDGPSANMPSWMNEFRSSSEVKSGPLEKVGQLSPKGLSDSPTRIEVSKSRLHHSSNLGSPANSPTKRGGSDGSKHSRRCHSKKDSTMGSPARGDSSGSSRHSRRQQKSNLGPQPGPTKPDQPAIPKSSRHKKGSKGSTAEGGSTKSSRSSRSSRSKGHDSLTEVQFADVEKVTKSEKEVKNNEEVTQDE